VHACAVRVATWNLAWATPGSDRHDCARSLLDAIGADIVITTEDLLCDWPGYPYVIDGGSDWGYSPVAGRRKVIAWSRTPWKDADVIHKGAARGRQLHATTRIDGEDIEVLGVCIPWSHAHVSTGRRDRGVWDEHIESCAVLATEIAGAVCRRPTVVAGDFNQRLPRQSQPTRAFDALAAVLEPLGVPTAGQHDVGALIDHIAVSPDFEVTDVSAWPNVVDHMRVSDHRGVSITARITPEGRALR
jgi:endonuclease/exonuclease/phosphatase (EEP) superfamily protein YafD